METLSDLQAFTRTELTRDTVIGRVTLEGVVEPQGIRRDQLLRDTYVVTKDSFPYMVSLERLSSD